MRWLVSLCVVAVAAAAFAGDCDQTTNCSGKTQLECAADNLSAGEWCVLDTNDMYGGDIFETYGDGRYILQYTESTIWDSVHGRILELGASHGNTETETLTKFDHYVESTNTWHEDELEMPPIGYPAGLGHSYDHHAYDPNTGIFYHRKYGSAYVMRFDTDADEWLSTLTITTLGPKQAAGGLTYFPDYGSQGSLIFVDGDWGVHRYDMATTTWTKLIGGWGDSEPKLLMGPYHNFAEYDPIDGVVLLGGGNNRPTCSTCGKKIYKLDSSGNFTTLNEAPYEMGTTHSITTCDPVSGKYLVVFEPSEDTLDFYEYDITTDTWDQLPTQQEPPWPADGVDGAVFGAVQTPIPDYGVTLWINYEFSTSTPPSEVYLYKHAEVTGECGDEIDNDGDGDTDLADADCDDLADDNETQCFSDEQTACSCDVPGRVLCYDFESATDMIDGAAGHPDDGEGWGESSGARIIQNGSNFTNCSYESNSEHAGNECWQLDTSIYETGAKSLMLEYRDLAIASVSPDFRIPFTDDGATTFGPGDSFEVAFFWRGSSELLSVNMIAEGSGGNWKQAIVGRGDKWDAPAEGISSNTVEEIVFQRDHRSPSYSGGIGGPNAYHSNEGYAAISECTDGCQIELQQTTGALGCYYPDGGTDPGGCGDNGGCVPYAADTWMAFKLKADINAWGEDAGNRLRIYLLRPGVDSDWVLYEDSWACDQIFDIHHDEGYSEGYGKVWLTGYTTGRDYTTGDGDGAIWYDHLIVSTSSIPASEYAAATGGVTPGSVVAGSTVNGGAIQ